MTDSDTPTQSSPGSSTVKSLPIPGVRIGRTGTKYDERGFTKVLDLPSIPSLYSHQQLMVSYSHWGVLRGLHYQVALAQQNKLVTCMTGSIYDVVVDLRVSSPAFGQWRGYYLGPYEEFDTLSVPEGCAHGYYCLKDSRVLYLIDGLYDPSAARVIHWEDPGLKIAWPIINGEDPIVSEADAAGTSFLNAEYFK